MSLLLADQRAVDSTTPRRLRDSSSAAGTDPGSKAGTVRDKPPNPALARQALRGAVQEATGTLDGLASTLPKLAETTRGVGGHSDLFSRYFDHGAAQLSWIHRALKDVSTLVNDAETLSNAGMGGAVLRMTRPRLQAALSGVMLLATWLDFLKLMTTVLQQCPAYSVEQLFADMAGVQKQMEPTLEALASLDLERVESAATAMPDLMGRLTHDFQSLREGARMAAERSERVVAAAQIFEMLTLVSALKMSLPRLSPPGATSLGASLMVSSGGVVVGSQLVVSAEWVEMMRRLVQAGILSVPVVGAAIRINSGQVMMAQGHQDLPRGVREALGEGPEVRGMHETGRTGAGMSDAPKHHVLPREHREWFEKRGFTGDMNIDQFCVRLEQAHHEAIHGGGNWRLGRAWPDEWHQMIMRALTKAERETGRMLTRNEILEVVAENMKFYDIPMNFIPGRRR